MPVRITLSGGEVVGGVPGSGEASVQARVANGAERPLLGLRIAVYYNSEDIAPQAGAQWRVHEFVFDPPVQPGATAQLKFSDPDAAQYVLIEPRLLRLAPALRYAGKLHILAAQPIEQGSTTFIAVRDLAEAVGATLSSAGVFITLQFATRRVRLKLGQSSAEVDGALQTLSAPLLNSGGRAYIAVDDAASVLGLTLAPPREPDLWELTNQ